MLKSLPSSFWISTAGFKFGIFHGEFRMSGRFAWSGLWRICSCYPWNMFEVSPKMYHYYRQHIYCAKKGQNCRIIGARENYCPQSNLMISKSWTIETIAWTFVILCGCTTWRKKMNWNTYLKEIGFGSTYCSKETLKNLHILCSIRKPM